jgi:hypothetical protein
LVNFTAKLAIQRLADRDSARRQAFCFFDFNLKAEALILLRLGCAGLAHEATKMAET